MSDLSTRLALALQRIKECKFDVCMMIWVCAEKRVSDAKYAKLVAEKVNEISSLKRQVA